RARFDLASDSWLEAHQVADLPAPSFLVAHPSGAVLYAVGETADGTVTALATDGVESAAGTLRTLGTVRSGGDDPCHLLLSSDARTLYVANYSSGTIGVLPLTPEGGWSPAVVAAGGPVQVFDAEDSATSGPGPEAERQDGSHAHAIMVAPGGRHLLATDLGTDELRRFRIRSDGLLDADGVAVHLPAGTGPRHLVVGPGDHVYVVGELDGSVHVVRWDRVSATAMLVQTVPACTAPPRAGGTGVRNLPSHIEVVDRTVVVGVRGADVLSTFAVSPGGSRLDALGESSSEGTWPRHFTIVDGATVVANQVSSTVVVTRGGDVASGVAPALELPSPACVVPIGT
ncbi:MAG TPA: beta-propeller fold lactonase family protein, partial [Cellulomonadaceae bacterium]|nr:beta-propeller fold lactonase family protein [Cellulomonadaceae bacterium]